MKKFFSILILFLFFGLINGFISCKPDNDDDNNDDIEPKKPSLTVVKPSSVSFEVSRGEAIAFDFTGNSNTTSNALLKNAQVKFSFNNGDPDSLFLDTNISVSEFIFKDTFIISKYAINDLKITCIISVKDANNESESKTIKMTVKDYSKMNIYERTLSSWMFDTGSFFSASTGLVYKTGYAYQDPSIPPLVDVVYYYGILDAGSFASPDDDKFKQGVPNAITQLQIHRWDVRKQTKFKLMKWGSTAKEQETYWNAVTDHTAIAANYNASTDPEASKKISISDGGVGQIKSYIGFKTSDPNPYYGIIRVDKQYGSSAGQTVIDITVKCQVK